MCYRHLSKITILCLFLASLSLSLSIYVCIYLARTCQSLWTFERFVDMELRGNIRESVRDVVSKSECQDLCLEETRFACLSANYDHLRAECHLSDENRFSRSDAFGAKQGVDYLENQCSKQQGKYLYLLTINHPIDAYFLSLIHI